MIHGEDIPRFSTILLAKRVGHTEPINLVAAFPPDGSVKTFNSFRESMDDPDIYPEPVKER